MSELAGLGRLIQHDPRSKAYPLPRRSVPESVRHRYWWCPKIFDQGSTPWCVAYSGFAWLRSGPVTNWQMPFTPKDLYRWAQERDEWPGVNYDGTSALGLMKALNEKGYISEYRWAFDVETIFNWLLTSGPVLFGSYWYMDMFRPSLETGFISVSGEEAGGHEYMLVGANRDKKCPDGTVGAARIVNSWGENWGQKGRAWISKRDLGKLLKNQGDCVTATEIDLDTSR